MPGQTNSWMGNIQLNPIPCIGDTVRKRSSINDGGTTPDFLQEDNTGGSTVQSASLLWWIALGLFVGYLVKGKKGKDHESRSYY